MSLSLRLDGLIAPLSETALALADAARGDASRAIGEAMAAREAALLSATYDAQRSGGTGTCVVTNASADGFSLLFRVIPAKAPRLVPRDPALSPVRAPADWLSDVEATGQEAFDRWLERIKL